MDNYQNQDGPDETIIEEMLRRFSPQPTHHFFRKMSTAPWQRRISHEVSKPSINIKSGHKLIWSLAAIGILVIIFTMILFIPSVRVAASQIIHLFLPASSNELDVEVTLTNPGDLIDFSDPTNFRLNVKDAQKLAGFGVKEISSLPLGLSFIGSRYDPSYYSVTLLYHADTYSLFLTQRLLGNGQDVFSIGASAIVKQVKIGNIGGEYVIGGWKAISTQSPSNDLPPTSMMTIYAIWDNELNQSTLRWQVNDIVYELRCNGEGCPLQSELILLANELK